MAQLDRSVFIALLNRLGAESEEEALAAARELHATIAEAGVSWDDLLIPDPRTANATVLPTAEAEDAVDANAVLDEGAADDESATIDGGAPADTEEAAVSGDEDDEEDEEEEAEEEEAEEEDAAAADAATPAVAMPEPDEPRADSPDDAAHRIERLLARKNLSKETRDELAEFQRDLAAGRLTEMDRRYVAALAKRLSA